MSKTVSVIIPTYNRAGLLEEAVKSVLCQSYKDFELIVVNDGSTDNTSDMLSKYPLLYLEQEPSGVTEARNNGLKAASGKYTVFLDDDDLLFDDSLEELVRFKEIQPKEVKAVYAYPANLKSEKDFEPKKINTSRNQLIFDFLISNKFSGLGLMETEMLKSLGGFDRNFPFAEDYELWTRIIVAYRIAALPKRTFLYRRHPGQSSLINRPKVRLDVDRVSFKMLYSINITEEAGLFLKDKDTSPENISRLLQNLSVRILERPLPALDTALEILKIALRCYYTEKTRTAITQLQYTIPVYLQKRFNTTLRISEQEKERLRNNGKGRS